ncbi:MAG TPA: hypothetical protein VF610_13495 [Segetibacter sp.]|jgi:hypothetical protein
MNPIFDFLQPEKLPIDFAILILVLLAGLFQKKYMEDVPWKPAIKTLIASFVFALVYAVLASFAYGFQKELPVRWFFSYCLATSLYELMLKAFFKKVFGDEKPADNV